MDHYTTLGVTKNANSTDIKKAYRKLANQFHPDKGGDTAQFQKIQVAYDTLSDSLKRQEYDNPQPAGFGGFPGGFSFSTGSGFPDIFGDLFRHHAQAAQRQAQIYRTIMEITLEQVYSGGQQSLKLQSPTGVHMVNINIPKGVTDGAQMRIENVIKDVVLIVEFRIHKHLKFDRNGNDLLCNYPISVLDLIVGTVFQFTTIAGITLEVTIQPKTQPHMQLRMAGHGLPILNSNQVGDQILLLKPFIPDIINDTIINSILQHKI